MVNRTVAYERLRPGFLGRWPLWGFTFIVGRNKKEPPIAAVKKFKHATRHPPDSDAQQPPHLAVNPLHRRANDVLRPAYNIGIHTNKPLRHSTFPNRPLARRTLPSSTGPPSWPGPPPAPLRRRSPAAHYANATHQQDNGRPSRLTPGTARRTRPTTRPNVHPAAERACAFPASKGCHVVGIREDGTLGGGIEACLRRDEIRGWSRPQRRQSAPQSARPTSSALPTRTCRECILQNRLVVDKNPGHVLGQATIGVDTHVRNCSAWKNGECVDNSSAPSRTSRLCFHKRPARRSRVRWGRGPGIGSPGTPNGDGGHFQLLNDGGKTHLRRPVAANDSSIMPVYQKTGVKLFKKNILFFFFFIRPPKVWGKDRVRASTNPFIL